VGDQRDPGEGVVEDPPCGRPAPDRGRLHLVEDDEGEVLWVVLGEEAAEERGVLPGYVTPAGDGLLRCPGLPSDLEPGDVGRGSGP